MKMTLFSMLAVAVLVLSGCSGGQQQQGGNQTGLPNPASVYCEEQGGALEIRTDSSGGQYGVCKFADGTECDEWEYYRGECGQTPASTNESCICTMEYMPVCGSDGITYGNKCGANCAGVEIASTGECNSTSAGGSTGIANPASVNCVETGGFLEIKTDSDGGQYGVCTFSSGAKCEEWALFRGECSEDAPNYCEENSDCACGRHITSGECFYGQSEFVDVSEQCPDFCTGIAAHLAINCENYKCMQVSKLVQECSNYSVDSCPANCVVCPPCAECSSISCQSEEFCAGMGFTSAWYAETQGNATGASVSDSVTFP